MKAASAASAGQTASVPKVRTPSSARDPWSRYRAAFAKSYAGPQRCKHCIAILLLAFASAASAAAVDCVACHSDQAALKDSVHGKLACTGCHTSIQSFPHPDKPASVNCGSCHADSVTGLSHSVHAVAGGPTCINCHGAAHSILPSKDPKSMTYPANLPQACAACHGDAQTAKKLGTKQVYSLYMDSIHGFALTKDGLLVAANCASCHGSHEILSSKDPNSKTNHANIAQTCGACHAGPLKAFNASIHGQLLAAGSSDAPVCTNCHTAHQISKVGTTEWQMKTTATCGGCHKEQFGTYRDTFHAQVSSLGYQQTARCWDCHGYHDILPASDANSSVAPARLVSTCGKCHSGANASFVKYDPHADSHDKARYPALHYSAVFMNVLLASVLGFFALHTILWFIRTQTGGMGPPGSGGSPGDAGPQRPDGRRAAGSPGQGLAPGGDTPKESR